MSPIIPALSVAAIALQGERDNGGEGGVGEEPSPMPPPQQDDVGGFHGAGDMGETGIGPHRKATATDDDPALSKRGGAAEVESLNACRLKIQLIDGIVFFRAKSDDGEPLLPADAGQGGAVTVVTFYSILGAGEKGDGFFRDEAALAKHLVRVLHIVRLHPEGKLQCAALYPDPGEKLLVPLEFAPLCPGVGEQMRVMKVVFCASFLGDVDEVTLLGNEYFRPAGHREEVIERCPGEYGIEAEIGVEISNLFKNRVSIRFFSVRPVQVETYDPPHQGDAP